MMLFPVVHPSAVEQMESGIHRINLGNVYQKAFDLKFMITTNLNLTDDVKTINTYAHDFKDECGTLGVRHKSVHEQCISLTSSIERIATQTVTDLNNIYNRRSRRWIVSAAKLWKAGPAILTSVGIIYQEAQIVKLQGQLADTKQKMHKAASALLKIEDLQFDDIEGKLNEVIQHQQEVQATETITAYAQTINMIFSRIKDKHQSITAIKPLEDLKKYVKPLQEKMPHIGLPPIGDEIFNIHGVQVGKANDLVTVTFTIPMVNIPSLEHWAIISVANSTGELWLLTNQNKIQRVVVHPTLKTFADVTETALLHPEIIENTQLKSMDECTESIFNDQNKYSWSCASDNLPNHQEEIVAVLETKAVLFSSGATPSFLSCENKTYRIQTAAIFDSNICYSKSMAMNIAEEKEPHLHPMGLEQVEFITPNPKVASMKEEFNKIWDWREIDSGSIISGILATSTGIIFIFIGIRCILSCRSRQEWLPNWDGPERVI